MSDLPVITRALPAPAENVLGDGIGRIELLDYMGGDLATVNGARASYGRASEELDDKGRRLIDYLGDHHHTTPLRHTVFQLRVKAPESTARQWYKHVVGGEYSFKDNPWSEFSQRFSTAPPEFYYQNDWRRQAVDNKQGAGEKFSSEDRHQLTSEAMFQIESAWMKYSSFVNRGVAREQARDVLPFSIYTEFVWTVGVQALVHFCVLREDRHAQAEIQAYARAVRSLCIDVAPRSWDALERNHPMCLRQEIETLKEEIKTLEKIIGGKP